MENDEKKDVFTKYKSNISGIIQFISCSMKDITQNYVNIKTSNVVPSKIIGQFEDPDNMSFYNDMEFFYHDIKEYLKIFISNKDTSDTQVYELILEMLDALIKYYSEFSNFVFIIDFYKCIMILLMQDNIFKKYIEDVEIDYENIIDTKDTKVYNRFITIRSILCKIETLQALMEGRLEFNKMNFERENSVFKYVDDKFKHLYDEYLNISLSMI